MIPSRVYNSSAYLERKYQLGTMIYLHGHPHSTLGVHRSRLALLYPSMRHTRNGNFSNKRKIADDIREIARRKKEEIDVERFVYIPLRISGYGIFISRPTKTVDEIGKDFLCMSPWVQNTNQLDGEFMAWIALFDLDIGDENLVEIFPKTMSSVTFCRLEEVFLFVPSIEFIYCKQEQRNFPLVWQNALQLYSIFISRIRK